MSVTLRCLVVAALSFLAVACATAPKAKGQPLYFAVEVAEGGKVIARPKLLGETGKRVRVERRQPGAAQPDYRLVLDPSPEGVGYRIKLDLALPKQQGHSELAMLHGEERRIELGTHPGDLRISLMVMKVDSPEFKALMELGEQQQQERARAPGSI
jgi:hypothetical protein